MADVFVSYDHEDRPFAEALVKTIEDRGFSVFWDHHTDGMLSKIGNELQAARVVVVVWSPASVQSLWVYGEVKSVADAGHERLVPVSIDGAVPPVPFNALRTFNLDSRPEKVQGGEFSSMWAAIERRLGAAALSAAGVPRQPGPSRAPISTPPDPVPPSPEEPKHSPSHQTAVPATDRPATAIPEQSAAARRKSYLAALILHLVGFGMFYAGPQNRRRWLYLLATLSVLGVLFLAAQPQGPFTRCTYFEGGGSFCSQDNSAIAAAMFPLVGILAFGLLDVLWSCRRARQGRQRLAAASR